jgi:hypothetical protein
MANATTFSDELWTAENWTAALGLCRCIGDLWIAQARTAGDGSIEYRVLPLPDAIRQAQTELANGEHPIWASYALGKSQRQARQAVAELREKRRILAALREVEKAEASTSERQQHEAA